MAGPLRQNGSPREADRNPGDRSGVGATQAPLVGRRPLLLASAALVAVNALHGLDHVRQGLGRLTFEVLAGGQVLLLLALVPLALTLRRDRRAPVASIVVGAWTVVAVAASHLAPHWSAISDPYADNDLDVVSWGLMLAVIAVAAVLGMVGLRAARHGVSSSPPLASR